MPVTVTSPCSLHMVGQQDAERGLRQRDIAGLIQCLVVKHHQPVAGHQQQRARRVVLEPHASRPIQPGGSLADRPVRRDLEEVRLQRPQAVQIGLDSRQVGAVLRGRLEAWLCRRPAPRTAAGRMTGGAVRVGSCAGCGAAPAGLQTGWAQTSTTTYCSSTVTGTVSAT